MKRIYSVAIAVLFGILSSFAEQIKVQDIAIVAGNSTTVEIGLDNVNTNLVAFQMDLTLPEGIGIEKAGCMLSSRITDEDQVLTVGRLSGNTYRLTSTSLSLVPISGTSGTLLILKLTSAANFVNGQATFSNVLFSTATSQEVAVADASFTINTLYTLTYQLDGVEYKTATVAYGTALTAETAPTKEGYTFSGWSEIPETMPANDIVVTGSFSVNSYTLTYKVDGEVYKTSTVNYGTTLTPETTPTKEGYTFSGWSEIPETMPAQDVVVTGSFAINQYTVTFKIGEDIISSVSLDYGTAIVPPDAPAKVGHTFAGWGDVAETVPAHDVTYTGSFTVNSYTLTYKVDGEVYKTSTFAYGTALTAETEPMKEGYTFSGWSEIPETMPANDVVVTGSFTVNTYKLTYVVDGEEYKTDSIVYNTEITPESEPTKEGYTFSGWSEIPETMPANDVVVTGSFTVNTYQVTFMYGEEVLKVDSVEYGAVIELPESLDSERYTLIEWLDVPETMPAHDVTIYASYTDGIVVIKNEELRNKNEEGIYDLNGRKLSQMQKGINVIRMKDGTSRKVLVK